MTRPPGFRLGGPLLKTSDTEPLPDTWRSELLHEHLDSSDRSSVALTCDAALSLLLQDWPNATLTVPVKASNAERPQHMLRRLQSAKRDLGKRGGKETMLVLQQEGSIQEGDPWWVAYLSALSLTEPAPHISLSLQLNTTPPALLSLAGQAFQGLQSLTLGQPSSAQQGSTIVFPPPSALPTLRHLNITIPISGRLILATIAPLLPQLVSLGITAQKVHDTAPFVDIMLKASARSDTLRCLTLPCRLDPQLLATLQKQAPGLAELTVVGIADTTDDHAEVEEEYSWRALTLTQGSIVPASAWEWLPMSDEGRLHMLMATAQAPRIIDVSLALSDKAAAKFASVDLLRVTQVRVDGAGVDADDQPVALRACLPQLAPLRAQDRLLAMHNIAMREALAAELAATDTTDGWLRLCLQAVSWPEDAAVTTELPSLDFLDLKQPLNDQVLAQMTPCVPAMERLYVPSINLTALPASGWPEGWPIVHVDGSLSAQELVRHAQLCGQGVKWECGRLVVCLNPSEVMNGAAQKLAKQLCRLQLTCVDTVQIQLHPAVSWPAQPAALRASLQILQALPRAPDELVVQDWPVTPECIAALAALTTLEAAKEDKPNAYSKLSLFVAGWGTIRGETWPIARLPLVLPRWSRVWSLDVGKLFPGELEAFVFGAPADRTANNPLTIQLYGAHAEWADDLTARLDSLATYPHVRVVGMV